MFVGFTPGVAEIAEPYINPKYGKIFKIRDNGFEGHSQAHSVLEGANIIEGHRRAGYITLGTGAVGWFNPNSATGAVLSSNFDEFYFPGDSVSLREQLVWLFQKIEDYKGRSIFAFLNVGETHVPYYIKGAAWDPAYNPCIPFGANNDRQECERRQIACVEFVDQSLADLLDCFAAGTTIICADHARLLMRPPLPSMATMAQKCKWRRPFRLLSRLTASRSGWANSTRQSSRG